MDQDLMFARGREAADNGNYDYAIAIFRDILGQDPDYTKARIAMRGCQVEKFREKGGGFVAKLSGIVKGLGPMLQMAFIKSPERTIAAGERFLNNYPTHAWASLRLADALARSNHGQAAIDTLESARQSNPANAGVLERLGTLYEQQGNYKKAVRCLEELVRLRPKDRLLMQRLKDLSARSHLAATRLDENESYRETIRDKDKAVELEKEQHLIRSTTEVDEAIAGIQEKLKEMPNNQSLLLRLGDFYLRKENIDFARMAYQKAHEVQATYDTQRKLDDLDLRLLQRQEQRAAAAAKAAPDNAELQARARAARQKRLAFAIETFEKRVEAHPTEVPLWFQLGRFYFERGTDDDIASAITSFQKTVGDSRHEESAHFMLGRCFEHNAQTRDMAVRQYEEALKLVGAPRSERTKDILYSLGALYERIGNKEKAVAWYKRLLEVDAGYRDVSQKIQLLG